MPTIIRVGGGGGKAGIDLTVVGGTTQPESPNNNTIWVKTETAIGTAYLSPTAPESHAVGDVWINTTNRYQSDASAVASSTHLLTVAEDPYLTVNVLQFKQWDGSAWNWRDGGIYANNAWTDMALYIFWYGTQNENYPIMGASKRSSSVTYDISPNYSDDYFYYTINASSPHVIYPYGNVCYVDVSRFSTVGIRVKSSRLNSIMRIGFSTDITSGRKILNPLSCADAQNTTAGTLTTNDWTDLSVPITASGNVRPLIGTMNQSYNDAITWYIAYWVLT